MKTYNRNQAEENNRHHPVHGGDWAGFEEEFGKEPLDFSMNVNPLGVPKGVVSAISEAAAEAARYPDPMRRRLCRALSDHEDVPCEWIYCGNGAADIIDRICIAFAGGKERKPAQSEGRKKDGSFRALVTAPTFSEYEDALIRCGYEVDRFCLGAGIKYKKTPAEKKGRRLPEEERGQFCIDENAAEMIIKSIRLYDLVFLCEPNNPTGVVTDRELLEKIADECSRKGSILVIDECFNGFLDDPESHTMKNCLEDHPNLIILRAFTKLYGMAGVRLGYCLCSDEEKLELISKGGQPWNVSHIAEEAGLAALKEMEYVEKARSIVKEERAWLKGELEKTGADHISGEANYILFRWDEGEDKLPEKLREEGILIRDCGNYHGLGKGWYRTGVKLHEENVRLVEALRRIREDQR